MDGNGEGGSRDAPGDFRGPRDFRGFRAPGEVNLPARPLPRGGRLELGVSRLGLGASLEP